MTIEPRGRVKRRSHATTINKIFHRCQHILGKTRADTAQTMADSDSCESCVKVLRNLWGSWVKVVWMLCESCVKVVWKLRESCMKVMWKFCECCVKVVWKLCESCVKVVWKLCESCVKVVWKLLQLQLCLFSPNLSEFRGHRERNRRHHDHGFAFQAKGHGKNLDG